MGASFYGELVVRITSDTAGLQKGMAESAAVVAKTGATAKRSWERVGLGMQNAGRTMTQFFTLPAAVGLGYAAYSAFKFETAMMKVKNLTGLTAAETKKYGDEILKLGPATGIGPQKLAEAFYFIASSGFKGAAAMKLLTSASKASAAGMGDVQTTADVLTSVLNVYGHSNITAAQATDILMKTIQVGKAEPEALSASLGRILPVAQTLGISFSELGGNIAALTLGGLSAAEATTSLRGTMMALSTPAKKSIDQLKEMHMTYQQVTKSIKDKGLLPTLEMLWQKTDHNKMAMHNLIPNVRALNGVLSLLGPNYKNAIRTINETANASGKLDEAFNYTRTQTIQKMKMAWASIQASFIKIGEVILPTLATVVTKIASLAEAFGRLPKWVQVAAIGFTVFVAAVGPFLMVTGSVIRSISLIANAFRAMAAARAAAKIAGTITDLATGAGEAGAAAGGAWGLAFAGAAALALAPAIAAGLWVQSGPKSARALQIQSTGVHNAGRMAGSYANQAQDNAAIARATSLRNTTAANAPLLQKLTIKATDSTGPTFKAVINRYEAVRVLTSKGISLKVDTSSKATTLNDLRSIEARMMGMGKTQKQAYAEMKTVFGSNFLKPFKSQLDGLGKGWGNVAKGAKSAGSKAGKDLASGLKSSTGDIRSAAQQAAAAAQVKVGDMHGIGYNLGDSLAQGMRAAVVHVRLAALDLANAAVVPVRQQTKTNSPSKVFIAMGSDFSMGLAQGMKQSQPSVVASAMQVAQAAVKGMSKGLSKSASKKLSHGADVSGYVGTLVDFVNSMTEALSTLANSKVPSLMPQWKANVTKVVNMALQISQVIAKQLQKAFPWTKGSKKVDPKVGKAGTAVDRASQIAGPVGDLITFVADLTTTFDKLTIGTIPSMTATVKTRIQALASAAAKMATLISQELVKAFPAATTTTTTWKDKKGKKHTKTTTTGGEALRDLLAASNITGPVGDAIGLAASTIDVLQAMMDIDPSVFEVPGNAFGHIGWIIADMAKTLVGYISGINIPDTVMATIAKLQTLAEAMLSLLDVMNQVATLNADSGTTGWGSFVTSVGGMVNAAGAMGVSTGGLSGGGAAVAAAAGGGGGDVYQLTFTGDIHAQTPEIAQASGAAVATAVIHKLATAKRSSSRTGGQTRSGRHTQPRSGR